MCRGPCRQVNVVGGHVDDVGKAALDAFLRRYRAPVPALKDVCAQPFTAW